MSQHYYAATPIDGKPVTVTLGYDRVLDYILCTVLIEGEFVYSSHSDPEAVNCQEVDYYREKLAELGITVPETMFKEVSRDQDRSQDASVGSRVVVHRAATPWILRIQGTCGGRPFDRLTMHDTQAGAEAELTEYVIQNWSGEIEEDLPEDTNEAVEQYFEQVTESYTIVQVHGVDPTSTP